jgi:hypothetical protein
VSASGLVLIIAGVWVVCQTLLADPSLLDVLGVS